MGGEAGLVRVESELLCLKRETLKLDEKIAQLYEQWRDSIYRYVILVAGNFAEAEEITQEAFLQLYRCLLNGKEIRDARSWVFRVAHNCALNRTASRKYVVPLDPVVWEKLCEAREDPALDPEQFVLEEEKRQRLQAAFQQLSALQQQCLLLRAEGFRYEQIAEVLDISISNVGRSLHRGIKKLMRDRHE